MTDISPESIEVVLFPEMIKIKTSRATKSKGHLTKIMRRDRATKELVKDGSECSMATGTIKTITFSSPAGFAKYLRSCASNQAIIHGVCEFAEAKVITKRKLESMPKDGAAVIARTKEFLAYPEDEPGVLLFDCDKARSGSVGEEAALKTYHPTELIQLLAMIHSCIGSASYVSTPSTSSCIYDAAGNELRGEGTGSHIYLFVKKASDIPRYLAVIGKRLFLAGYGRIEISRSGALLQRTLVDLVVASPERLDFVAGAVCEDGLVQKLPWPTVHNGEMLDTESLPDLSQEEEAQYQAAVAALQERAKPAQAEVLSAYIIKESAKLSKSAGIPLEEAQKVILSRQDHVLADEDILYFSHEKDCITVAEVLKDGKSYHGKSLGDPLEPSYEGGSKTKAKFYWNDGNPVIHSYAHGSQKYSFKRFIKENSEVFSDEWPEPSPLISHQDSNAYPLDALPNIIGAAVREVIGFVQCPVALAACSALSSVSAVGQGLVDVRRAEGLEGPASLFLLALADSGERKTTVDNHFSGPIKQWERDQATMLKPALLKFEAQKTAWEAKKSGHLAAIQSASKSGKDSTEFEMQMVDLEMNKPEAPPFPQLLFGDSTPEALAFALGNRWPIGAVLASEAGIVFGAHGMNKDSVMRNLALLNTLWDGQPLRIDRKSGPSFTVDGARLTMGLAVQPETVKAFLDTSKGLARGIGFLARFLIAWPESTQGERMYKEPPLCWPNRERFHFQLSTLLSRPLEFDEDGRLQPLMLELSPEAKKVWVAFHDDVENELRPGRDMAEARDVASKAADNAARLAALFHVFEDSPGGSIAPRLMEAAARIVSWHLYEARRFIVNRL